MPIAIPRALSKPSVEAGPSTAGGRGLKGLFSRSKVASPEPVEQPPRSRFRTLVDDVSGKVPGGKATQKDRFAKITAGSFPSGTGDQGVDRNPTPHQTARRRPQSPEVTTRRGRLGFALPPAMQKGNDGRWQPPSLSKGSMSTSALNALRDGDDEDRTARPAELRRGKPALHGLFISGREERHMPARADHRPLDGRSAALPPREESAVQPRGPRQVGVKASPAPPVVYKQQGRPRSPSNTARAPSTPTCARPSLSPAPSDRPGSRHTSRIQVTSSDSVSKSQEPPSNHSHAPHAARATVQKPAQTPPHSRSPSISTDHLSADHYHLRLATSFLLKTLTPVVKGSAFASSDKNLEMRRLADERLAGLGRIEKNWGADWIRAAAAGFEQKTEAETGTRDGPVRIANVGERAKDRERKGFLDALRDGVLLCL